MVMYQFRTTHTYTGETEWHQPDTRDWTTIYDGTDEADAVQAATMWLRTLHGHEDDVNTFGEIVHIETLAHCARGPDGTLENRGGKRCRAAHWVHREEVI